MNRKTYLVIMLVGALLSARARAALTTNSWIDGNGKWETSTNWSLGVPPSSTQAADLITNAGNNTVTIDGATLGATLTVSNILIRGNTLSLSAQLLTVFNELNLTNNSTVVVNNAEVDVYSNLVVGSSGTGNQLNVTNSGFLYNVSGSVTIGGGSNNSVVVAAGSFWEIDNGSINIRNSTPGIAIKIAGGSTFDGIGATNASIGNSATAVGNIVIVTDPGSSWSMIGSLNIGGAGHGAQFIVSNSAAASAPAVVIGDPIGFGHSATLAGSGSIWTVSNSIDIGKGGTNDSLTVSGGTLSAAQIRVNGATLLLQGGMLKAGSLLLTNGGAQPAKVWLTGGTAFVTNTTGTGQLNLFNGSLILSNTATLIADTLTNVSATFTNLGGTFILKSAAIINQATATFSAGFSQFGSSLAVGTSSSATGTVNVTGGTLTVTNGVFGIGNDGSLFSTGGVGRVFVAGGLVQAGSMLVGDNTTNSASGITVSTNGHVIVGGGLRANGIKTTLIEGGTLEVQAGAPSFEDPALHNRISVGFQGDGRMLLSNGTVRAPEMVVGHSNGRGTFEMSGGVMNLSSNLLIGLDSSATGTVFITGGTLTVTNGVFGVGSNGLGRVSVSNGLVEAVSVLVGDTFNGDSGLTIANTGHVRSRGGLRSNGIKTTLVNGGTLEVVEDVPPFFEDPILHNRIVIAHQADGKLVVSNGTVQTPGMIVGASAGQTGSLSIAGGVTSVYSNLIVGLVSGATGIVNITSGSLFVTNVTGNATFEVRNGTVTMSGGFLQTDRLVVTNANAHLIRTGGTLLYTTLVLDPNQSAVGDGIPNGWKQQYGFDPFSPAVASADSDGDGMSNQSEFQSGTDPTNSVSAFRITSVVRTGNDVRVTWTTGAAKTNALQFGSGPSYTTNFSDLFIVTNTTGSATNYLDVGVATNVPARYYRVRLVP